MDSMERSREGKKRHRNPLGAAHVNPRDAYRDVPILKQPTWNHEVAAYFFFGGISAGSAMVGSLAEVAGGERHKRLARVAHYVSLATLLPCPPLLIDDLGMPRRFHHMLRIFKPSSPMNLGSWALTLHGAGATVMVVRMLADERKLPIPVIGGVVQAVPERLLAGLGIPSSFVLAGYTGVLLGTTSIPVWQTSPLLGALFMSSAFSTGIAATNLVGLLTQSENEEEEGELAALALASGVTEAVMLAGYVATTGEAAAPLMAGEPGLLMGGAVAGLAAAALLELVSIRSKKHKKTASLLASVAALISGALLRWAVVRAGRVSAADREGTIEAMKPREGSPGWGAGV
ncbi:MAG: NrfD/PsrC family molybdoenzyme membrane anchor subunit [Chloroflexota bacterium]